MRRPTFVLSEQSTQTTVLIVDKTGSLGYAVAKKIHEQYADWKLILVGEKDEAIEKIASEFVLFKKKSPKIPDLVYSYIFIFYNQEPELTELLPDFVRKSEVDRSKFFFVSKRTIKEKSLYEFLKRHETASLVWLGDVFGEGSIFDPSQPIHRLLDEAERLGKVSVRGMGMGKTYSVHIDDTVNGIIQSAFGESKTKNFFLFPKNTPTELSLAMMLHKVDPLLKIDFMQGAEDREVEPLDSGEYVIEDSYPLLQRLKKIDILQEKKVVKEEKKKIKEVLPIKKSQQFSRVHFFLVLICLFMLPFIILSVLLFGSYQLVHHSKKALEKGDVRFSLQSMMLSHQFLRYSKTPSQVVTMQLSLVGQKEIGERVEKYIYIGEELTKGGVFLLEGTNSFNSLLKDSANYSNHFISGINNLKQVIIQYQKTEVELTQLQKVQGPMEKWMYSLLPLTLIKKDSVDRMIHRFGNVLDISDDLMGIYKEKKYLVLFQNNMELRPGGGFIGSYGILTVNKGTIQQFTIHDVYDADGQLKAHIEPPFPIRRYLPSVHWYMRDSNFDVDFSKSASSSAYFLNLETQQQVDGVVAIDTTFIKNILAATGPIYVSDYQIDVDENNFYELTQEHVHKNFFPGSSQKKDFLRSFFIALQNHVFIKRKISYTKLLDAIDKSLQEKHLLFAFSNASIQNIFELSNASFSLTDSREEKANRVNNYLYISDANLGVNKVNYEIKKKVTQKVTIQDTGSIEVSTTILYKNNSTKDTYKNFVQLVVPRHAAVTSITIDGVEQPIVPAVTDPKVYEDKKFIPPPGLEVYSYDQDNKTIHGFLVQVPQTKLVSVVITYTLEKTVSLEDPTVQYSGIVIKQPGTVDDQFVFSLKGPSSYRVSKSSSGASLNGNSVEFRGKLNQDKEFHVEFSRQ